MVQDSFWISGEVIPAVRWFICWYMMVCRLPVKNQVIIIYVKVNWGGPLTNVSGWLQKSINSVWCARNVSYLHTWDMSDKWANIFVTKERKEHFPLSSMPILLIGLAALQRRKTFKCNEMTFRTMHLSKRQPQLGNCYALVVMSSSKTANEVLNLHPLSAKLIQCTSNSCCLLL